jgi:hypothetical protein
MGDKRRGGILAAMGAALGAIVQSPAALADGTPREPLVLEIENASSRPLRCVIVLAHFFTVEAGTAASGGVLEIGMDRDPSTGSLSIDNAAGTRMMIEQILCGESGRWSQTRAEVALTPLRGSASSSYRIRCVIEDRTLCAAPAAFE